MQTLAGDLSITEVRKKRHRALAAGRPAPPAPITAAEPECLRDFTSSFFRRREEMLAPHTLRRYVTEYRLRIDPHLGHLPLEAIDRRVVEEWWALVVAQASSPETAIGAYRVLRLVLEAAVGDGLIATNAAAKLTMPPADPDRVGARRVLNPAQLWTLLDHPTQTLRIETMLRAAAEGGLRRSEICGAPMV